VPRTYDAEFRRRVVELVRAGRPDESSRPSPLSASKARLVRYAAKSASIPDGEAMLVTLAPPLAVLFLVA
jgi:hypothetical protein